MKFSVYIKIIHPARSLHVLLLPPCDRVYVTQRSEPLTQQDASPHIRSPTTAHTPRLPFFGESRLTSPVPAASSADVWLVKPQHQHRSFASNCFGRGREFELPFRRDRVFSGQKISFSIFSTLSAWSLLLKGLTTI